MELFRSLLCLRASRFISSDLCLLELWQITSVTWREELEERNTFLKLENIAIKTFVPFFIPIKLGRAVLPDRFSLIARFVLATSFLIDSFICQEVFQFSEFTRQSNMSVCLCIHLSVPQPVKAVNQFYITKSASLAGVPLILMNRLESMYQAEKHWN